MKTQNPLIIGIATVCMMIPSFGRGANVYANSQNNGADGTCTGCNVSNPDIVVDGNDNTYGAMNLTVATGGAYVYQNLFYAGNGSAGDYVVLAVEDDALSALNATNLGGLQLTTYLSGVSNNDTRGSNDILILLQSGSRYALQFQTGTAFDQLEVRLYTGGLTNLRVYYSYHNPVSLPVKLLSFTGITAGNSVTLKWKTASESGNSHYIMERNTDEYAGLWEPVADIETAGNMITGAEYEWNDRTPSAQKHVYYRLKQSDMNGEESVLGTVQVMTGGIHAFSVYPNPAPGDNIFVESRQDDDLGVAVYDLSGTKVMEKREYGSRPGLYELEIGMLLPGAYQVVFSSRSSVQAEEVIIQ